MYLIVVKFTTKPEHTDTWLERVTPFTLATRAEPGNLFFEWSRSTEEPDTFVLVEGFTDDGAAPHVNSAHFAQAMVDMREALASTPRIISRQVDGQGWEPMGELQIG